MKPGKALLFASLLVSVLIMSGSALGETTCKTEDCEITITIKIAFAGATDQQIQEWVDDIEDTWNGPYGVRTTGDCQCLLRYKVETMKITNASQVNCNPPPAGYHCVMVTNYSQNPPRNQTAIQGAATYRGYMYNVSQSGESVNGWWSDIMNDPHPTTGGDSHDAAHEAGHMMGLGDDYNKSTGYYGNNLMGQTSGGNATPTQDQIDQTVENVCGPNACPDECCCGNGVIESGKGEGCDPFAEPNGCPSGEACCPICCSCYAPQCIPANGEYFSQADCMAACPLGSSCYLNYRTGCWDCKNPTVVVEKPAYDPEQARQQGESFHMAHQDGGTTELPEELLNLDLSTVEGIAPLGGLPEWMAGMFANERINIIVDGTPMAGVVMEDGVIISAEMEPLEDPTMNMLTTTETILAIFEGELSFEEAILDGDITMEGVGFNAIKMTLANIGLWFYSLFAG